MSALQPWPVCPRPQPDESLPSWFERIGAEYRMTPNALLLSFDLSDGSVAATAPRLARETAERLQAPHVRSKIAALSRLPDTACNTLWPSSTGWELVDGAFRSYCPHCCLGDLREQRTPYGRRGWQQSWLNQQREWPAEYRRRWWIPDPSVDISRYDTHPSVKH